MGTGDNHTDSIFLNLSYLYLDLCIWICYCARARALTHTHKHKLKMLLLQAMKGENVMFSLVSVCHYVCPWGKGGGWSHMKLLKFVHLGLPQVLSLPWPVPTCSLCERSSCCYGVFLTSLIPPFDYEFFFRFHQPMRSNTSHWEILNPPFGVQPTRVRLPHNCHPLDPPRH